MFCQICRQKATYRCCSTILLCNFHFSQHFSPIENHHPEKLVFKLETSDQSMLNIELQNRISTLEKLKSKVRSYTKSLITNLIINQSELLNKIDQIIKEYQEIFTSYEFYDLKAPQEILTTEMIVKEITSEGLISQIDKLFPRDLIYFDIDLDKKKNLMKNKFLKTHNGGFLCLAISNDGKLLLTGSDDQTVRVWDFFGRKQIACYAEHKSNVNCVVISSTSNFAVSGSMDRSLIMWDLKNHCVSNVFRGHTGSIQSVALSFDENFMISGGYNYEIYIWNMKSFQLIQFIETHAPVYSVLFASNEFFVSGIGKHIQTWNINSSSQHQSLEAHDLEINSIARTSSSTILITGSDDKTVKLWESSSLKKLGILKGHTQAVKSVCVTSDDSQIISSSNDYKIIIWSIKYLSKIHEFSHHDDFIFGVINFQDWIISASRDARIGIKLFEKSFDSYLVLKPFTIGSEQQKEEKLAYGSLNTVVVWDLNETEISLRGHSSLINSVCFTSNSERLVSASYGQSKNLIVWDLQEKSALSYLEGHSNSVFCVDISYDDTNAISGDAEARVLLWDLVIMKKIWEFKGHTGRVYSVKFTKNMKFAASAGSDEKVFVWDIENKAQYAVLCGHQNYIWKVSITRDDKFVVSATFTEGIFVWDLEAKSKSFGFGTLDESRSWLQNNQDKRSEFSRFLF